MSETPTYEYSPFIDSEQFRLLTLKEGAWDDEIQCSLNTRDLEQGEWFLGGFIDEDAGYEALSYTWGDSALRRVILVDGALLPITKNLYTALRYLRYFNRPRTLWIDAICIDQQNLEERSAQVKLMFRIFGSATRVIVWPGKLSADSDVALDIIQSRNPVLVERLSPDSAEFKALENLFYRSWWNRTWVIQEVVYSKKVDFLVGRRYISWDCFYCSLLDVRDNVSNTAKDHRQGHLWRNRVSYNLLGAGGLVGPSDRLRQISSKVDELAFARTQGLDPEGFEVLLPKFGYREASDPRDKIYSMLKIVSDDLDIVPDYTKSVSEVYINLVKTWVSTRKTLDILTCRPKGASNIAGLPSWSPDWTQNFYASSGSKAVEFTPFSANESVRSKNEVSGNTIKKLYYQHHVLHLSGFIYSEIVGTAEEIPDERYLTDEWQQFVRIWEPKPVTEARLALQSRRFDVYPQAWTHQPDPLQTARRAHWEVLTSYSRLVLCNASYTSTYIAHADHLTSEARKHVEGVPLKKTHEYSIWFSAAEAFAETKLTDTDILRDLETDNLQQFVSQLREQTIGRKLCTLQNGKMALVPNGTEVGDVMCMLMGGRVPFVLRPPAITRLDSQVQNAEPLSSFRFKLVGPGNVQEVEVEHELEKYRLTGTESLEFSLI